MAVIKCVMLSKTIGPQLTMMLNSDIITIVVQRDKLCIRGGTWKMNRILSCGISELYGVDAACVKDSR